MIHPYNSRIWTRSSIPGWRRYHPTTITHKHNQPTNPHKTNIAPGTMEKYLLIKHFFPGNEKVYTHIQTCILEFSFLHHHTATERDTAHLLLFFFFIFVSFHQQTAIGMNQAIDIPSLQEEDVQPGSIAGSSPWRSFLSLSPSSLTCHFLCSCRETCKHVEGHHLC